MNDSSFLADLPTLSQLFTSRLGYSVTVTEARRSKIGNGQETWFIETVMQPFVLRRSAAGGALTWTSRATEFEALSSLQGSGLPIPQVLWQEPDGGSLQRAYFVMEHLPGKPPARHFDDKMAFKLGQVLAQLHQSTGTADRIETLDYLPTKLAETLEKYAATLFVEEPLAHLLFGWLEFNIPLHNFRKARLWGDPGPHNMLVSDGHISGLLDWEMTSMGHPLEDLGSARWSVLGFASPRSIDDGYATVGADTIARDRDWFEVLAHLVRAGQALDGTAAFLRNETDEVTLPAMGLGLVTANLLRAATVAWQQPELGLPRTPLPSVPTKTINDDKIFHRLAEVSAHFATLSDTRSAARLRITEVLKLAYQNRAHQHSFFFENHQDLRNMGETARAQESSGQPSDLRQMLVDDVCNRRLRMSALLDYFGPTTSTSVAR